VDCIAGKDPRDDVDNDETSEEDVEENEGAEKQVEIKESINLAMTALQTQLTLATNERCMTNPKHGAGLHRLMRVGNYLVLYLPLIEGLDWLIQAHFMQIEIFWNFKVPNAETVIDGVLWLNDEKLVDTIKSNWSTLMAAQSGSYIIVLPYSIKTHREEIKYGAGKNYKVFGFSKYDDPSEHKLIG